MIDVHAHWFPPALVSEFASHGLKVWPAHPESLSSRADELGADGFSSQVLGLGHNQPYLPDAAAALRCAQFANDLYADVVGGPFAAFGTVPLPHPESSASEAVRCLDDLGFAGIGVGTTALDASLDDPRFDELWSELDSRAAVVFVHPVGVQVTGLDAFFMGPKHGGPLESTIAATRLVVSGVTRRFPRIRWIVSPMGGALGFLWRRFEEMTQSLGHDEWLATDPARNSRNSTTTRHCRTTPR
ncbi:amidohydrolase family protein [Amycolatopsis sp. NPDC051903]|uniref:amidohydrolase family protein n=1 Tax=Amycolatopsis sp. NPDC051903 TaxID=3363936 RepID=UPI0037AB9302